MTRQVEAAEPTPHNVAINVIRYGLSGRVFKRNLPIALVVGSVLTVANQLGVILHGPIHVDLLVKICFNFRVPFVVSSVSAYGNRRGP